MAEVAQAILGVPVALEVSIINVDKPPLDYAEIERRLRQFPAEQPVWLTRARHLRGEVAALSRGDVHRGRGHAAADRRAAATTATTRSSALAAAWSGSPRRLPLPRLRPRGGQHVLRLADLDLPEVLRRHLPRSPAGAVPRGHLLDGHTPVGGVVAAGLDWWQAHRWQHAAVHALVLAPPARENNLPANMAWRFLRSQ